MTGDGPKPTLLSTHMHRHTQTNISPSIQLITYLVADVPHQGHVCAALFEEP